MERLSLDAIVPQEIAQLSDRQPPESGADLILERGDTAADPQKAKQDAGSDVAAVRCFGLEFEYRPAPQQPRRPVS